jgi:hypothetical protein
MKGSAREVRQDLERWEKRRLMGIRLQAFFAWLVASIVVLGATLYARSIMVAANPALETQFLYIMLLEVIALLITLLLLGLR